MGQPVVEPLYLGTGTQAVFGLLTHAPGDRPLTPVLLCPPFGFDDVCSYRSRRDWALHLAERGHPTVRIDLPGTGDSGGGPRDPGRLDAWTAAVAAAARWLSARCDGRAVTTIGIGLGGLLACRAAARGAPIGDLVLWGTPATGRQLVRELRAFARLEVAKVEGGDAPMPDGGLLSGGYLLTAETVADLGGLDVAGLDLTAPAGARALLLGREHTPGDEELAAALRAAGYAVREAPGPGYTEMMDEPHLTRRPPRAVFAQVDAWLGEGAAAGVGEGLDGTPVPQARAALDDLVVDGVALRESVVTVPQLFGDLFGVLTVRAGGEPAPGVCALLLNPGAQRHIGPNRMWVETARRWAARGVPVLRLDLSNIGEADSDGEPWNDDVGFHGAKNVEQVRAAMDLLQERGHGDRFLLMGLCSGAYWSFQTCLVDPRARAAVLLNPRALVWSRMLTVAREGRRVAKLRHLRVWRRIFTGQVPRAELRRAGRRLLAWPALAVRDRLQRVVARAAPSAAGGDALDRALQTLGDGGKQVHIAFASHEPLRDELAREGRLERIAGLEHVELRFLPPAGPAHELQPLTLQQAAAALADAALDAELARARVPDVAPLLETAATAG